MAEENCIWEIIKVVPTYVGVSIALWATFSWRRSLHHQRADEHVAAARAVHAAIANYARLYEEVEKAKPDESQIKRIALKIEYDRIWPNVLQRYISTHAVARRYHSNLPVDLPDRISEILSDLAKTDLSLTEALQAVQNWTPGQKTAPEVAVEKSKAWVEDIESRIGPVRKMPGYIDRFSSKVSAAYRAFMST